MEESRILFRGVTLHKGKWLPKVAYILAGKRAILEGDPRCPYNTRDEAFHHTDELVAYLQEQIRERQAPPPAAN